MSNPKPQQTFQEAIFKKYETQNTPKTSGFVKVYRKSSAKHKGPLASLKVLNSAVKNSPVGVGLVRQSRAERASGLFSGGNKKAPDVFVGKCDCFESEES